MSTGINLKELIKENILNELEIITTKQKSKRIEIIFQSIDSLKVDELLREVKNFVKEIFSIKGNDTLFFKIALRLDDENEWEEAIFFYRLSNLINPNPKAINNLAIVYMEIGREKEAKKLLEEGIKLFPDNKTLKENLEIINN